MSRLAILLLVILVAALAAGCEEKPREEEVAPLGRLYVPSTMIADTGVPQHTINPYTLLPESDAVYYPIDRAEKFMYGSYFSNYSSVTVYTYDWQRISSPRGSGFRFTDSVQSWESAP